MKQENLDGGEIRISDVYEAELNKIQLPRKRGKELMKEVEIESTYED